MLKKMNIIVQMSKPRWSNSSFVNAFKTWKTWCNGKLNYTFIFCSTTFIYIR